MKHRAVRARHRPLSERAVDELLAKLRAHGDRALTEQDYDALLGVVQTWAHLSEVAARDTASIREVRRVLGISKQRDQRTASGQPDKTRDDSPGDEAPEQTDSLDANASEEQGREGSPCNRNEHGRRSVQDFEDLEHTHHAHVSLRSGDECPCCARGRIYKYRPNAFTTISGRSPLVATRHTVDTLQCNLCKEVFPAPLPAALEADGVGGRPLYTHSAVAMVCILRCFGGLPMSRQDRLQKALGVPVPDSSIWDMHERLANAARPLWRYLLTQAKNAPFFFGDDTGATILDTRSAVRPNRRTGEPQLRTGCHTTCVIASSSEGQDTVLFMTGIHHTGEVMDLILEGRDPGLPTPVFMGDCIESNTVTTATVYYAGCNAHAVRRFKELAERYPDHAAFALERYRKIYDNDDACIDGALSPEQRLRYHREHSRPLLREITEYGEDCFEQRHIEPNSDLGEAFEYVIGNERRLSAFARHAGVPLDNNRVERTLRTSVRLRETTRFFRNAAGAGVADTILTVGASALAARVNLFEYFVALLRHADDVRAEPDAWTPWSYAARRSGAGPPANCTGPPPLISMA